LGTELRLQHAEQMDVVVTAILERGLPHCAFVAETGFLAHSASGRVRFEDEHVDAMQIQIVKCVTHHFARRERTDALAVSRAIPEQHVIFRVLVNGIDAGQAGQTDELGFVIRAHRTPDVRTPALQICLEPSLVDFDADVTMGGADARCQRSVLPPAVDNANIRALELSESDHRTTSRTTSHTRCMSSAPYRWSTGSGSSR